MSIHSNIAQIDLCVVISSQRDDSSPKCTILFEQAGTGVVTVTLITSKSKFQASMKFIEYSCHDRTLSRSVWVMLRQALIVVGQGTIGRDACASVLCNVQAKWVGFCTVSGQASIIKHVFLCARFYLFSTLTKYSRRNL